MIHFNELRIDNSGTYLIIDATVDTDSYFDSVYLDNIKIDTQDTFIGTGPSSHTIYTYSVDSAVNTKNLRLVLDVTSLGVDLVKNMFFIYVTAKGTPNPSTPASSLTNPILGTAINLYPIYQKALYFSKGVLKFEHIDHKFIDFILKYKMLLFAVNTGNYTEAITYWNQFFKTLTTT